MFVYTCIGISSIYCYIDEIHATMNTPAAHTIACQHRYAIYRPLHACMVYVHVHNAQLRARIAYGISSELCKDHNIWQRPGLARAPENQLLY